MLYWFCTGRHFPLIGCRKYIPGVHQTAAPEHFISESVDGVNDFGELSAPLASGVGFELYEIWNFCQAGFQLKKGLSICFESIAVIKRIILVSSTVLWKEIG